MAPSPALTRKSSSQVRITASRLGSSGSVVAANGKSASASMLSSEGSAAGAKFFTRAVMALPLMSGSAFWLAVAPVPARRMGPAEEAASTTHALLRHDLHRQSNGGLWVQRLPRSCPALPLSGDCDRNSISDLVVAILAALINGITYGNAIPNDPRAVAFPM